MIITESMLEIVARLRPNPDRLKPRLTPMDVAEIRATYPRLSLSALGAEYGVTKETIRQIVLNRMHRDPKYVAPVMPRRGRP
jgi:hypothetical protein